MKTKLVLLSAAWLVAANQLFSQSQNSVGIGTETPNPNAVLELIAIKGDQGFLAPRLTSQQRILLGSKLAAKDNGLLVFDSNEGLLYAWNNGAWNPVALPKLTAGAGILVTSTEITNTGDTDPTDDVTTSSQAGKGDVTGSFNSFTVAGLQGKPLDTSAPAPGATLVWDGTAKIWKYAVPQAAGVAVTPITGLQANNTQQALEALQVNKLSTLSSQTTDDLNQGSTNLYYTDAKVTTLLGNSSVDALKDVNTAGAQNGQVLKWDGSAWVPGTSNPGDMTTSIYDTNGNNIVDHAENAATVNGMSVETAVPQNAVFTDGQTASEVRITTIDGLTATTTQEALEALQVNKLSTLSSQTTDDLNQGSTNLYYTDSKVTTLLGTSSIDALSDVDVSTTAPSTDQVLKWGGSAWVPGTSNPGDMTTSTYDTDKDGIVDNAATVNGMSVETAVPQNAVFTDGQTASDVGITTIDGLTATTTQEALEALQVNKLSTNSSIDALSDVDVSTTAPATDQVLKWDGSAWVPGTSNPGDMTTSTYDTNGNNIVDHAENAATVNGMSVETAVPQNAVFTDGQTASDVGITTIDGLTATTTQEALEVLQTNKLSTNSSIDALSDVDVSTTAPSTDQVLKWDGSAWVPGTDNGTSLQTGKILLGNTANVATPVSLSGAITLDDTGATKITDGAITDAHISISSTAKIAGNKIIPNFGDQPIITSKSLTIGAASSLETTIPATTTPGTPGTIQFTGTGGFQSYNNGVWETFGGFSLPFVKEATTDDRPSFSLTNTGTGGVASFTNNPPAGTTAATPALSVINNGNTNYAAEIVNENADATVPALQVTSRGSGSVARLENTSGTSVPTLELINAGGDAVMKFQNFSEGSPETSQSYAVGIVGDTFKISRLGSTPASSLIDHLTIANSGAVSISGDVTASRYIVNQEVTKFLGLHASAFHGELYQPGSTPYNELAPQYYSCLSGINSRGEPCTATASLNLPQGATINKLTAWIAGVIAQEDIGAHCQVDLISDPHGSGAPRSIATINLLYASPKSVEEFRSTFDPVAVDNENYTYYVMFTSNVTDYQLYDVQIAYTISEL